MYDCRWNKECIARTLNDSLIVKVHLRGLHSFFISSGALKDHYIIVHVHLILQNGKQVLLYRMGNLKNLRINSGSTLTLRYKYSGIRNWTVSWLKIFNLHCSLHKTKTKYLHGWHLQQTICEYILHEDTKQRYSRALKIHNRYSSCFKMHRKGIQFMALCLKLYAAI